MQRKSYVITAALVAGLVLGIIFSPVGGSSTASAQTEPPAQTASPFDSLRTLFLDKLAAALNIQRSALDSAITSAGTSTVDEAAAQGTLSQAQADDIKARIQAGNIGALWGGHGGRGRGGPRVEGLHEAMFDAAAQTLNITADELRTQLHSGQTLAQLAQAQGTTEVVVTDAALAAAKTKLAEAVTAGTLTQAQADEKYAQLQAAGANILSHGGRGPRGGNRAPGAPVTPEATPTTDGNT